MPSFFQLMRHAFVVFWLGKELLTSPLQKNVIDLQKIWLWTWQYTRCMASCCSGCRMNALWPNSCATHLHQTIAMSAMHTRIPAVFERNNGFASLPHTWESYAEMKSRLWLDCTPSNKCCSWVKYAMLLICRITTIMELQELRPFEHALLLLIQNIWWRNRIDEKKGSGGPHGGSRSVNG